MYTPEFFCKLIHMCNVFVCAHSLWVQGVQAGVRGPGAREAAVIVEAGRRAEDSIAALGRLSAVGRAALICHQRRHTPLSTNKTLT